jgi:hypothetical protein
MDSKKKGIGIFIAAILVISVFAVMCTPASADGAKAMISLKNSDGTYLGVQVSDLEGMGIEIIEVGENFVTASVTEEQFEMLKEEGYLVAWLKEELPQALGAITGPVAIFQDNDPWVTMTSTQDVLTANGIAYWFESYANNGGILEIHAADGGWGGGGFWPTGAIPCGFTWTFNLGNTVDIALPGNEMLTTPNVITDAELDGWGASYHGYFTGFPAGSELILTEGDTGFANPVLIVAPYGSGCVIASGQTLEWGYWWGRSNLLENVLLYECGAPAPVPAITPIGLIALVGLLSVIAAISISTTIRKKR